MLTLLLFITVCPRVKLQTEVGGGGGKNIADVIHNILMPKHCVIYTSIVDFWLVPCNFAQKWRYW